MAEFNPGGAASLNEAVMLRYEANPDVNRLTDGLLAKLNGIEPGATADMSGTEIVASLNATLGGTTWQQGGTAGGAPAVHTHPISDITGLQGALDGKAATTHTHTLAQLPEVQTALNGKQAAGDYSVNGHGHVVADVSGLQTLIDGKAPTTHTHTTAQVTGLDAALAARITSSTAQAGGGTAIANLVALTRAQYAAITTPSANTVYLFTD